MLVHVETYSRKPENTNIEEVLQQVAPSVSFSWGTSGHSAFFEVGQGEDGAVHELLESLQQPQVIPMLDECSLAVCLDFHFKKKNERTEIGKMVYQAKYDDDNDAARDLAERAALNAYRNPILRRARRVAIVPPSKKDKETGRLLQKVSEVVSDVLEIPRIALHRTHSTKIEQKKIDDVPGGDPEANQRGTMRADPANGPILVLDDLMGHGSSVREAARALKAAGASEVMAFVLSKNRKGTKEFAFPPD